MANITEIQNVRVLPNKQVSAEIVHKKIVDGVTTQEIRRQVIYTKDSDLSAMIEMENNDELRSAIASLKP